jgi:DNA-binding response OmpR family regulator
MKNHTRPTRIVLVEDGVDTFVGGDGDVVTVLTKSAQPFSFMLCHVRNANEIFSLSAENEVDIILFDVSRSRAKDFAMLEQVCEAFSIVPVIAIVASDERLTRAKVLLLGAVDVILKSASQETTMFARIYSAIERKREELERQQQRYWEKALAFLQQHVVVTRSTLTPETLGMKPLSEAMPYKFLELTKSYSNLLELAETRRTHSGSRFNGHSVSQKLHFLASDLCSLKAGVWDVIDIHAKAIEQRAEHQPKEETRQLLLELVTDLVSHYRRVDYANA